MEKTGHQAALVDERAEVGIDVAGDCKQIVIAVLDVLRPQPLVMPNTSPP